MRERLCLIGTFVSSWSVGAGGDAVVAGQSQQLAQRRSEASRPWGAAREPRRRRRWRPAARRAGQASGRSAAGGGSAGGGPALGGCVVVGGFDAAAAFAGGRVDVPPPRRPQRRLPPGARSLCSLVQRNRPRHEGAPPALLSRTSRPRRETLPNAARHSSRRSTPPAPNEPAFDIRAPHPSLLKRETRGRERRSRRDGGAGRPGGMMVCGVWCVVCGVGPT